MNTNLTHLIRTATLTTFVAILACVSTASPTLAGGQTPGEGEGDTTSQVRHPGESQFQCRMSPDAVERWAQNGATLPPCIQQANLAERDFADDRRQPIG